MDRHGLQPCGDDTRKVATPDRDAKTRLCHALTDPKAHNKLKKVTTQAAIK